MIIKTSETILHNIISYGFPERRENMEKGISIVHREGKRIAEGIGYYEPSKISDLRQIVKDSAKKYGNAKAFLYKDKQGNITGKLIMTSTGTLMPWVRSSCNESKGAAVFNNW